MNAGKQNININKNSSLTSTESIKATSIAPVFNPNISSNCGGEVNSNKKNSNSGLTNSSKQTRKDFVQNHSSIKDKTVVSATAVVEGGSTGANLLKNSGSGKFKLFKSTNIKTKSSNSAGIIENKVMHMDISNNKNKNNNNNNEGDHQFSKLLFFFNF